MAACVCFRAFSDGALAAEFLLEIGDVAPYESGQFYLRELPCVLAVLTLLPELPAVIIIDGYVWLAAQQPGLGARLYEAVSQRAAVIGVAKSQFVGAQPVRQVIRGGSQSPLFVTAAGMDVDEAARHIRAMHGPHRIPTLLKRVDQLSRGRAREGRHRRRKPTESAAPRKEEHGHHTE